MAITNFTNHRISSIKLGEKYHLKSVPFYATEAEWSSIDYVPSLGETIVYNTDDTYNYLRFKTGDGETQAKNLPFSLVTQTELELFKAEISSAGHLKRKIVNILPETEIDPDTIYMIRTSLITNDNYDEWMYIEGAWELIGNTRIDLSDYVRTEDLPTAVPGYSGTVESVSVGTGLKITGDATINPCIAIDEEVIFVLYGGTSTEII